MHIIEVIGNNVSEKAMPSYLVEEEKTALMECLPSKQAFLGLEPEDAVPYELAKAVIIPFGLEASVSYGKGTAKGPAAMIKASHQVELFDEQFWCEPFRKIGIATLKEGQINKSVEKSLEQLSGLVCQALQD